MYWSCNNCQHHTISIPSVIMRSSFILCTIAISRTLQDTSGWLMNDVITWDCRRNIPSISLSINHSFIYLFIHLLMQWVQQSVLSPFNYSVIYSAKHFFIYSVNKFIIQSLIYSFIQSVSIINNSCNHSNSQTVY